MKKKVAGCQQIVACTIKAAPTLLMDVPLYSLIHLAVDILGLSIVRNVVYRFEGGGKTIVCVLAESHLVVETFPEDGIVELEIASCRKIDTNKLYKMFTESEYELQEMTGLIKNEFGSWGHGLK